MGVSGRVSAGNTHTGQREESLIKGCVTEMWVVLEEMNRGGRVASRASHNKGGGHGAGPGLKRQGKEAGPEHEKGVLW